MSCGQDISLIVAGHAARLSRARLFELAALVQDGSVTPLVDRPHPLAETPAAMRYLMARHPARWS
ncbi:MAG TPA: zinc-binding dehydrogenase [Gaiellaceae bacterium]|nr:zinc-binding dehydrogenase [Gaiellaceae bacterium]